MKVDRYTTSIHLRQCIDDSIVSYTSTDDVSGVLKESISAYLIERRAKVFYSTLKISFVLRGVCSDLNSETKIFQVKLNETHPF